MVATVPHIFFKNYRENDENAPNVFVYFLFDTTPHMKLHPRYHLLGSLLSRGRFAALYSW